MWLELWPLIPKSDSTLLFLSDAARRWRHELCPGTANLQGHSCACCSKPVGLGRTWWLCSGAERTERRRRQITHFNPLIFLDWRGFLLDLEKIPNEWILFRVFQTDGTPANSWMQSVTSGSYRPSEDGSAEAMVDRCREEAKRWRNRVAVILIWLIVTLSENAL